MSWVVSNETPALGQIILWVMRSCPTVVLVVRGSGEGRVLTLRRHYARLLVESGRGYTKGRARQGDFQRTLGRQRRPRDDGFWSPTVFQPIDQNTIGTIGTKTILGEMAALNKGKNSNKPNSSFEFKKKDRIQGRITHRGTRYRALSSYWLVM